MADSIFGARVPFPIEEEKEKVIPFPSTTVPAPFLTNRPLFEISPPGNLPQNANAAAMTDPNIAAADRDLEKRVGVPAGTAGDNTRSELKKRSIAEGIDSQTKNSPVTRRLFTQDKLFPILASDDVPNLVKIEKVAKEFGILGAMGRSIDLVQTFGFFRPLEAVGEFIGSEGLEAFGQAGAEEQMRQAEAAGVKKKFQDIDNAEDLFVWMTQTAGEQSFLMAPGIAGSIAGAKIGLLLSAPVPVPGARVIGPLIGAVIGAFIPSFVLGVGETQQAIKEKDKDTEAPGLAFGAGALIGALDSMLPGKIGSKLLKAFGVDVAEQIVKKSALKIARDAAKAGGKGMLMEGITEAFQEAISESTAAFATDTEIDTDQLVDQMIEAFAAGAFLGFGVSGITSVAADNIKARRTKKITDNINKLMKDGKLYERAPDKAAELVAADLEAAGITEIWVSSDALLDYAANHPEGTAVALTELGLSDEAFDALIADKEVALDAKLFAQFILGNETYNRMAFHVKLAQDDKTVFEAAEVLVEDPQLVEEVTEELETYPVTDKIKEKVTKLLAKFETGDIAADMDASPDDVNIVLMDLIDRIHAKRTGVEEQVKEGRLAQIDVDIKEQDRIIDQIEEEIQARDAFNEDKPTSKRKPTVALQKKQDKAFAKRDKLADEQEELLGPEVIVGATFTIDGKIFHGINHPAAMKEAEEELGIEAVDAALDADPLANRVEDGFLTSRGRIIDRETAIEEFGVQIAEDIATEKFDPEKVFETILEINDPSVQELSPSSFILPDGRIADALEDHLASAEDAGFHSTEDFQQATGVVRSGGSFINVSGQNVFTFSLLSGQSITREQKKSIDFLAKKADLVFFDIMDTSGKVISSGDKTSFSEVLQSFTIEEQEIQLEKQAVTADTEAKKQAKSREAKIKIKAKVLLNLGVKLTTETVRAARSAFKAGVKTGGKLIDAQKSISRAIDKLPISASKKTSLKNSINSTKTFAAFQKKLAVIQSKAVLAVEQNRKSQIKSAIQKVVKRKIKPKKEGTFTESEIRANEILTKVRELISMDIALAEKELTAALEMPVPGPDAEFENIILSINVKNEGVSASTAEQILLDLEAIAAGKKEAGKIRRFKKDVKINSTVLEASAAVTQGKDIDLRDNTTILNQLKKGLTELSGQLGSLHNAWDELVEIVFDKKGVDTTSLKKILGMSRFEQETNGLIFEWQERLVQIGMESLGLETQAQFQDYLYDGETLEDLDFHINEQKRKVRLQYTRNEARKMWMELQDPTIAEAYRHKQGNAYTENMMVAIDNLLSPRDKAFAQAQLDFYQEIYKEVDKVYRRVYGVALPFNPFYSPVSRDKGAVPLGSKDRVGGDENILVEDIIFRGKIASSLKKRKPNLFALSKSSDVGVLYRYQHDMATFIKQSEQSAFLLSVFKKSRLRDEIIEIHGISVLDQIDGMIKDFTVGYPSRGRYFEKTLNFFNRQFSRSVLGLKAVTGMKQLPSFIAMSENIPIVDFMAGVVEFLANPKKAIRILYGNGNMMKSRGSSLDFEMSRYGAPDKTMLRLRKRTSVDNFIMWFIKAGDRAAIYSGGWARYLYQTRKGNMSPEEAILDFEQNASSTQQSSDISRQSSLQRSGAFGRVFTMFMTARLSLLRGELRAIRQFSRGKITAREFGKRLAIYHFFIPMIIQGVASGFRWEPDKQLTAMLLGQLNGFIIFGELLHWAVLSTITEDATKFPKELPLTETLEEAWKGAADAFAGDSMEEILEGFLVMGDVAGKFAGIPFEAARGIVSGGLKIIDGDPEEGMKLMWGFSRKTAKESSK